MADWSIWKALEEWRNRWHELAPIFACTGIAPEVESAVNLVCVNLKRQPPTPPLLTGDKMRDDEEFGRYYAGVYRHFDDSFQRAENLLRLPWVPEAAPAAEKVRTEIQRLRQVLHAELGLEWERVDPHTGMAEIAGVNRGDLSSWSTRATQLREWASGHLRVECDEREEQP